MKNNKNWIILIVVIVILIGCAVFFFFKNNSTSDENNQENNSYEANRTSATSNTNEDTNSNENKNPASVNTINTTPPSTPQPSASPQPKEEQISSFSTKIYSSDSARQNNISITCRSLNGTIVKNGASFSFCNTVGPSTTSKGYQKADIFDNNGQKKKGLGGGNCQISTTLYNAILNVPSIKVTERHAHSNNVPYIQKGKDAAVAYGSYDLKFVNNTGNDIKINTSASAKEISVSIIALK